jgi:hydrogenase-4 component F
MTLIALLLIPLVAAGLTALVSSRRAGEIVHLTAAFAILVIGLVAAAQVWQDGALDALSGLLYADALSALLVTVIVLLGAIAAVYAVVYLRAEQETHTRRFFALFQLFLFTMLLTVTTNNLGVMWVAVEGTTLATVFLVNLRNTRTSLEAAYKYLIISSVGIAMAFIGTALMYSTGSTQVGESAVNWMALRAAAPLLNPQVVRLAFVFILIGYGTKSGFAPMHTWLPDAHSEAPAPISALMSGVLLNVGLYALLRFKTITDAAVGSEFSGNLLLGIGLLSLAVAAIFLLTQSNYKRMLAYSSVEHMGIIALGLGFGGYWGVLGAMLHLVGHALAKSLLFILSGNVMLRFHTSEVSAVRGLVRAAPWLGGAFLAGILALLGLPPFSLFISEFLIARAGLESRAPWLAVIAIALFVVVFGGMLANVNRMLYTEPTRPSHEEKGQRAHPMGWVLAPLAVNFTILVVLGLTMPSAVMNAFNQVLRVLGV